MTAFAFVGVVCVILIVCAWFMNLAIVGAGCTQVPFTKVTDINVGRTLVTVHFKDGSEPFLGQTVGKFEIISHWPIRLLRIESSKTLFERDLRRMKDQGFLVIPDTDNGNRYIPMEVVASMEVKAEEYLLDE